MEEFVAELEAGNVADVLHDPTTSTPQGINIREDFDSAMMLLMGGQDPLNVVDGASPQPLSYDRDFLRYDQDEALTSVLEAFGESQAGAWITWMSIMLPVSLT